MGKGDLRHRVASMFELPGDVLMDVARVTMIGNMELLIENHRGLSEYKPDRVVLGTPQGDLSIHGEELVIGSISPEHVIVLGRIRSIAYST